MPLFRPRGEAGPSKKGLGLGRRLRKLFHLGRAKTKPYLGSGPGTASFVHRLGVMFARSMIVLVVGVAWWVVAPWLLLVLFPSFSLYNQWITNYGTDIYSVYAFWQVLPEVLLFMFGFLWTGGILDLLFGNAVLENVF